MKPETARVLRALFFAYVAFTFLHIAYVVYHEPFAFDAWNVAVDTGAKPPSIGRFFAFWHQQYTTSNPRIGQPMAYLAYKIVGVAEIGTPLAFLALVLGGFVFGARRWPRLSDGSDLAALTIGIGFLWFIAPNFPAYLFCRAYATNYVWLAAIQLWFLVPLRLLDPAAPKPVSIPKVIGYLLLGVVAGMGNEHVGPTLIVFVLGYGVWIWRKHHQRPALVWVGAAGLLIGFALIFFAPGQSQRYEGLAEHYTVIQQILVRGLAANINIYLDLFEAAGPLLALLVCVIGAGLMSETRDDDDRARQRTSLRLFVLCLVAASLITITIWASPKLGPRFYLHAMFLLLAAGLGVVVAFLRKPRALAPFVAVAVLSSGVAALRTIPMFARLDKAS
ncbi:MAG TPA: DUF6056 family protein, partial [Kofleriaceae bacterium]|nr:DUF6056 family protein [Kofleriaceae bacterium]